MVENKVVNSRYDNARKWYSESKQLHKGNTPEDNTENMKNLEKILNIIAEDVKEYMPNMSPSEKSLTKQKIEGISKSIQYAERGECTLDRIDPNGNYCPENCRWISNKEQCNNKRNNKYVEMDGEKLTLQQWCDKYNISQGTVRSRIKKGMDFETAVKMPLRRTYKDMSEEELVERKRKRAEQSKKWVKDNWEYVYKQRKEWREKHIDSVRASQRKYEEKKRLGSDAEDTVE